MGASHGDYFGFLDQEIFGSVQTRPEQLKSSKFFQFVKNMLDVSEATARDFQVFFHRLAFEKRFGGVLKEGMERKFIRYQFGGYFLKKVIV